MVSLFIAKEQRPAETRVAATPESVKRLVKLGHTVTVEKGAGAGAYFLQFGLRDTSRPAARDESFHVQRLEVVESSEPQRFRIELRAEGLSAALDRLGR